MSTFLVATGGGIGNVIHTTSLVAELARWGEVDFWIGGRTAQYYQRWDVPRRVWRAAPDLGQYDAACWCSKLSWQGREGWRPNYKSPDGRWRSEWDAPLDYVRDHLGPLRAEPRTHFPVPPGPREPYTVLAPTGDPRWPVKRWPYWAELAEALGPVVIVGLPHDDLYAWPAGALNLCGKLALDETALVVARARRVVSHECGMGHLAAVVGTETYMLFGPTCPVHSLPPGPHVHPVVAWNRPSCQPCLNSPFPEYRKRFSRGGERCPLGRACLERLAVAHVLAAMGN